MDLDAKHYKKYSQQQYNRSKPLIEDNITSKNAHVLDVGCGDGKITAKIAALVPNGIVLGIDSSRNMIDLASETFRKPNLKFQCSKAEEFISSDTYDNIFCFSCLIWIRKPKLALERLAKLLKPGGNLLILTYLKESSYVDILEKTLENFPQYKPLSAVHTMLLEKDHYDILESCDLQIDTFETRNALTSYSSKSDLKNYLRGWLNCYVPLPEELHDVFLDQAIETCLKYSVSKKPLLINLPYKTLTIKARK
ncbi:MAG: Trans-aconitate 2-methyltransferase [Chlamydiae bacterium]|nr:Trans-aconitate 2-methyltransferase [Chlamydiota bacterium]